MRIFPITLAILGLITLVLFGSPGVLVAADPPNVLIILVDDMGYGDPGCFNPDSKIPTPNIDRLAKEGMKFTDAHAPGPLCHVSRYGLMTGRYPWRHQFNWRNGPVIDADRLTLAAFMKQQGYQTHMVGKWHLGFSEDQKFEGPLRGGPVDRGFDSYFGIRASTDIPPYFYIRGNRAVLPPSDRIAANRTEGWSPIQGAFWRAGGIAPDLKLEEVLPRFTREAIDVIENHGMQKSNQPMMLYLAYPAPHTPWLPAREFIGKSEAGLYGDFMNMVDANIGQVLTALERNNLHKDTLVIFTSDNGPVWYEKDVQQWSHDSSGGLRGMKADAWECGHRMPFVVRWPDRVKPNTTSRQMICFTDVFATLSELVASSIPEGQAPDSVSFYKTLIGLQPEEKPIRESLVIAAGRGHTMIRAGNWKLITGPGSGGFSKGPRQPGLGIPKGQLYHLGDDLGETKNLYETRTQQVQKLIAVLQKSKSRE
ncbi:MAG: arylsulfatase [Planctomycetota bacterium]|nr:arylsulfatase [Planctomycetota bacterium]